MKLYFGNATTTATTIMILCLLGFMGYTVVHRENVTYWGRRSLLLLVFGLVICCFAAARDGLDKTIPKCGRWGCAPGGISTCELSESYRMHQGQLSL